jgi:hypothetical protein
MRRVLRTQPETLTHTFAVGETPTDASGAVTVAITDANGDPVSSGNATHGSTGQYSYVLPGQAALKLLRVAWTGTIAGTAVTEVDSVEIVGGRFFTLLQARNSDKVLQDTGKYTTDYLDEVRLATEIECEDICDRSFFPRYTRLVLDGSGTNELMLTGHDIRTIRSVKVAPQLGQAFVAFTSTELAALAVTPDRVLQRTDGNTFTEGRSNVIVELEYGLDEVPADLQRAALLRLKTRCIAPNSGIPQRATSYTNPDGASYRLSLPGPWETGIPDVDGIYSRYSLRDQSTGSSGDTGGRAIPASRTLNYDPQRNSLFHGGVR